MAVNYEDVLTDLEIKKAALETAINTIRQLSSRGSYPNPFSNNGHSGNKTSTNRTTTFGFGRNKGVSTDIMALEDLRYYESWLERTLADPSKRSNRKFAKNDEDKLSIVKEELKRRGVN